MNTLLELVKGLEWPEGAVCVVQDSDGVVKWLPSMPCDSDGGGNGTSPDCEGDWWFMGVSGDVFYHEEYAVGHLYELPLTSDWNMAIITKEMWESVQSN